MDIGISCSNCGKDKVEDHPIYKCIFCKKPFCWNCLFCTWCQGGDEGVCQSCKYLDDSYPCWECGSDLRQYSGPYVMDNGGICDSCYKECLNK